MKALGLDSLAAVGVLVEVEDTFGVTLPDSSLVASVFETGGSLWAAIEAARATARRERVQRRAVS